MQLINSSTAYWERRNNMIKTNNKQMTNNYTKVFVNRDSTCWYMKLDHSIRKAFLHLFMINLRCASAQQEQPSKAGIMYEANMNPMLQPRQLAINEIFSRFRLGCQSISIIQVLLQQPGHLPVGLVGVMCQTDLQCNRHFQ